MRQVCDDYERNGHSTLLLKQELFALDCTAAHVNLMMTVQQTSETSRMLSMPQTMDNVQ
jgi:hypothetical protein